MLYDSGNESAVPASRIGFVHLVGAGPGDPDLLTVKASRLIASADVIVHDRLVSSEILALAGADVRCVEVGKTGFGPSWKQDDINALIVAEALSGHDVLRLKGGDPVIFGRLDEEIEALDAAGIDWEIIPGVTSASASAAAIGQSLTRRGRNSSLRILTGHDVRGFAEHDWRALAREGSTAAIYMGSRAAEFLRGRLMMHGAAPTTPVTIIENASRPDERVLAAELFTLPEALASARISGPVMLLLGIEPRAAAQSVRKIREVL